MISKTPGENQREVRVAALKNLSYWRMGQGGRSGRGTLGGSAWAIAIAGVLWLAGCGGGGSTNVRSVAITPSSVTSLPLNQQTTFTATITLSNSTVSTTTNITWEVDGAAGGSATVGTIVPSSVDQNVGVYTAPGIVPNPATVNITAVVQQTNATSSTSSTLPTVTSNTATVTIGLGLGLAVTPAAATVHAGAGQQFTALLNSVQDPAATWSISSASGITDASVIGSIDLTGVYSAPASPPPGGTITVTAMDGVNTATATVSVVYSDLSLNGPYAFSYTGNDESGYLTAAGSFLADGQGHITSGVEDVDSFLDGLAVAAPISGTYSVGNDGRGTATITRGQITERWRFALTTGLHAAMTLSEPNATGGGTIDQQSVGALSNSPAVITGPYVFSLLGADASANRAPLGIAGEFSANGGGDVLAADGTLIDVNDDGTITSADTSLNGTYAFDANNPDSGRGTITLQSNSLGATPRLFAFYAVSTSSSTVTQLHLVEIDDIDSMAGDMFSAPSASELGSGDLSAANYAFTYGGSSSSGAYAAGGVFTSDGSGSVTGGVLDTNNAGTTALDTTIGACTSSLDGTKRRIALTCTAGSTSPKFAMYQTSQGSAVMLEIDPTAVATGTAYAQCGPSSAGCAAAAPAISADSVALGLIGQGIFHNSPSLYQQDIDGQISISSGVTPGSIDINNFTATFVGDPISTVTLGTASSLGRGTTVMTASTPAATYNLIYYLIDDKTALVFDQDTTYVLRGTFAQQY
ncbi:MAG: hypothetical protein WBQ34_10875 [Candidatus Acidiferrales bacterium]